MPSSPIRQSSLEVPFVRLHTSASDLLSTCQRAFRQRERDANIIYPFAIKSSLSSEQQSQTSGKLVRPIRKPSLILPLTDSDTDSSDEDEVPQPTSPSKLVSCPDEFWLSVWSSSYRNRSSGPARLDFVLSCTKGPIGEYPIFLYSNHPDDELTPELVVPRIELLANHLRACTPATRVYSVFGPNILTKTFVTMWMQLTNAEPIFEPYYSAKHTFCNRSSLSPDTFSPLPAGHGLRPATMEDLEGAAEQCHGFAASSEPFVLSHEDARREALGYIQQRQMFVYSIASPDSERDSIASIVCVTRTSENVSAITKVFTSPSHRGKRYAERLVRHVTQHYLYELRKESVVLFVAHDNIAAEKVYDRVGFMGLCGKPRPEGVNDWIEIGFADTNLGHW